MQRKYDSEAGYYSGFLGEPSDTMGEGDATTVMMTPSGAPTKQAEPAWYETLIKTAVPAIATAYQQRELTKLNIARMNSGQAPLTAAQYAAVYQPPSAQVQIGATSDTKRLLMYAAIGVAALVGLRAAKII